MVETPVAPPELSSSFKRLLEGLASAEHVGKKLKPGELEDLAEKSKTEILCATSAPDLNSTGLAFRPSPGMLLPSDQPFAAGEIVSAQVMPVGRIMNSNTLPAGAMPVGKLFVPGEISHDRPDPVLSADGPSMVEDQEIKIVDPGGSQVPESDPAVQRYKTFMEVPFHPTIKRILLTAGFAAPSQIQQYAWPIALQGKDLVGVAATGSGKTLAYLLPVFTGVFAPILGPRAMQGPAFLVLAPTRELALQIEQESMKFGQGLGIRVACVYGGQKKKKQVSKIRVPVHGVIGTPGRVNDFLEGEDLKLENVTKVVFDEADRMLDMGFEPQIRQLVTSLPVDRQTLFFTATWPTAVRSLAFELSREPFQVHIGNRDELKANQVITQIIKPVKGNEKMAKLVQAMMDYKILETPTCKSLVFVNNKRMCCDVEAELVRSNVPVGSLHGDKSQSGRTLALDNFKSCMHKILVATDVAARGLDIPGVTLVVNYDLPDTPEDYIHRIGRTGRAGKEGTALSLVSYRDYGRLSGIVEVMRKTGQKVDAEVERLAKRGGPPPPVFRKGVRVDTSGRGGMCADFQKGRCTRGDNCRFSHGMSTDGPAGDMSGAFGFLGGNYGGRERSPQSAHPRSRDRRSRDRRSRHRSRHGNRSRRHSRRHSHHRSRDRHDDRKRHRRDDDRGRDQACDDRHRKVQLAPAPAWQHRGYGDRGDRTERDQDRGDDRRLMIRDRSPDDHGAEEEDYEYSDESEEDESRLLVLS